jgi:N-acetylglucosamine malate deacetylase 1
MKALFLGAHCDDIELGCGATIHKRKNDWEIICAILSGKNIKIDHWDNADRDLSNLDMIAHESLTQLGASKVNVNNFKTCYFYKNRNEIWEFLHNLEVTIKPDIVFSQDPDTNQDHLTLYQESLRNFKKVPLLCYRQHGRDITPFNPTTFSVVSKENVDAKMLSLSLYNEIFYDRIYFQARNLIAEMVVHGLKIEADYAEAFSVVKNYI